MKRYNVFLNGSWRDSERQLKVIDPSTGDAFAEVATVDRATVKQALTDAQASFAGWKKLTAKRRGDFLRAIANELSSRHESLAELITRENGKPIAQARGEVDMAIDHLLWFAEEGRRTYGRVVPPQADGKRHLVIKQPVGVVGAIAPWNFPLVLALRKIAPALAAGCPVILKPASATPLSAIVLAECVEAAKLPQGVFQVVIGKATEIADEFLENPICRKISFTGSTKVGRSLIAGAANTCTELSLELGGNAPLIVFKDADFDRAIEGILITKFRNNGQSCIASNRIYLHSAIFDRYKDELVERVRSLKVGDGSEPGVDVGPLVDAQALESALSFVEDAVAAGGKIMTGGKRYGTTGNFLEPTVISDVPEGARCYREEIFAPVVALYAFDNETEVLEKANDSEYGLAAYVFTTDLNRSMRVAESLEAGTIGVNDPVPSTSNCPFGGFKQSGWGRELGIEGIEAFLKTKHICIGGIT